jgi:hypothetical protein
MVLDPDGTIVRIVTDEAEFDVVRAAGCDVTVRYCRVLLSVLPDGFSW